MQTNIKLILIILLSLSVGLGAGYFLFNKEEIPSADHPMEGTENGSSTTEATIYTCSMHPQIRQPEQGICPICEMDLTPLSANTSDDPLVLQMSEEAVKLANIQTTVIGTTATSNEKELRLSGKIQVNEKLAASLVAHVPGRIEKLFVSFTGEMVTKGQRLATVYSPELITAQQELIEAVKLRDFNPNLLEAARNKLRFLKIGQSVIDEIEQRGTIQETFTLFAEESGIVTNRRVAVGDHVNRGEPLFEVVNLSRVWVIFDAYEEDLAHIKVGDRVTFTTPALPDKTFETPITFINPVIDPNTRTASLRAEVNNRKGVLKPEMFVTGTLQNKTSSTAQLTVPKSAVMWTGKRSVVYVKVPDTEIPSYKFKVIEIGQAIGSNYQVISGLEAGEEVVTYGSFTIDAAAQLNNQASMMNQEVEIKKEGMDVEMIPDFTAETPEAFKKQLSEVATQYILLKDALVATDATTAIPATEAFLKQLEGIDMTLLKGDAHEYWMEQLNALQAHGKNISTSTDVEEQRKQFGFLSTVLINTVQAFGTAGKVWYVQHCPMAFDNEGADWLALEEQIQNPYFGDKMMKCGLVKRTFGVDNEL